MNRILVTGATGFIGYEVSRQLASMGARPRLLIRRPLRGALLSSLDAEFMQGDLESPDSLKRAVEGMKGGTRGIGIPFGRGLIYHTNHTVEPIGGSLQEFAWQDDRLVESHLFPADAEAVVGDE